MLLFRKILASVCLTCKASRSVSGHQIQIEFKHDSGRSTVPKTGPGILDGQCSNVDSLGQVLQLWSSFGALLRPPQRFQPPASGRPEAAGRGKRGRAFRVGRGSSERPDGKQAKQNENHPGETRRGKDQKRRLRRRKATDRDNKGTLTGREVSHAKRQTKNKKKRRKQKEVSLLSWAKTTRPIFSDCVIRG